MAAAVEADGCGAVVDESERVLVVVVEVFAPSRVEGVN